MNTLIAAIQTVLRGIDPGLTIDDTWGPRTQAALDVLLHRRSAPPWPFTIELDGSDIVVRDVVITCFGGWGNGIADLQDKGNTASGLNTRTQVLRGVSVPMDGRQFSSLSQAEHHALDGCPIPRLLNERGLTAWHTPVEVTIEGKTWTPPDGIIDLGPGLGATRRGTGPHALDVSVLAALYWEPDMALRKLANDFEKRGSFRIIGGAKLSGLVLMQGPTATS